MAGVSNGEPVVTTFAGEPGGVDEASPELIGVEVQLASVNAAAMIGTHALTADLRFHLSGAPGAPRAIRTIERSSSNRVATKRRSADILARVASEGDASHIGKTGVVGS